MIRPKGYRPALCLGGFRQLADSFQRHRQVMQRVRIRGPQPHGLLEPLHGLLGPAEPSQQPPKVAMKVRRRRVQGNGPFQEFQRLVDPAVFLTEHSQKVDGVGIIRIALQHPPIRRLGFADPPVLGGQSCLEIGRDASVFRI